MSAPVISTTTSILDYEQHQEWAFQPTATNAPTGWTISPAAPTGMDFDSDTGKISGAATVAGVYVFNLYATNGDGTSDPLEVTVGIGAAMPADVLAVDVDIDIAMRTAVVRGVATAADKPSHTVKFRDDQIYRIRFLKNGIVVNPDIVALSYAMKSAPDDSALATSSDWAQVGYGLDAAWLVYGKLDSGTLGDEILSTDAAAATLTLEFEWLQANTTGVGPDPLRGTSQAMLVLAAYDYQQVSEPEEEA